MRSELIQLQPTLRRLLEMEALSEAHVICGEKFLDRPISQVVSTLFGGQRPGTLILSRAEAIRGQEIPSLKEMSGLILIRPVSTLRPVSAQSAVLKSQIRPELDLDLEPVLKACNEANTPLVILPSVEDSHELIDEIRAVYLSEVKRANARLHSLYIRLVLEDGLEALVERVSNQVGRPCLVETSDFKLLAAHNMGPTPLNQQKTLTEEIAEVLNRELRSLEDPDSVVDAVRVGRRLVAPIILEGAVLGYFSMMLRPQDDDELMSEYLRPALLASLVEFGTRRKEFATNTVTHRSLLKDLLAGENLAGSDQERLEQFFGLDICEGSLVMAVRLLPEVKSSEIVLNEERLAMVEMEGACVFVLPIQKSNEEKSWQEHAIVLHEKLKSRFSPAKVQMGVSRLVPTLLELPDAYREARQSLVTGSMMHGDNEFMVGFADLGVKRLLYLMFDHPELERFYQEHLAPLEAYDAEWETELLETLRVYLEQGYNLNSAAKELFVHRHTMRYRLEQIAELLKVDIDSSEVLLNLQVAFRIREMRGQNQKK